MTVLTELDHPHPPQHNNTQLLNINLGIAENIIKYTIYFTKLPVILQGSKYRVNVLKFEDLFQIPTH